MDPLSYVIFNSTKSLWVSSGDGEQSTRYLDSFEFDLLEEANQLYTELDKQHDTYYVLAIMPTP